MRELLRNRWFTLACRLILGAIFIYASLDKVRHPGLFAEAVHNYHILPIALENLFALTLPWIELGVGVLLVAGFLTRSSALVLGGLTLVFIVAIAINLWRGVDMACGCFSLTTEGRHLGWRTLAQDLALILPALALIAQPLSAHSVDALLGTDEPVPRTDPQ